MESAIVASDKGSTTLVVMAYQTEKNNYLCRCQDYSMIDGLYDNTRIAKGGTPLPHPLPRVRKHERIHHHINTYDDWYRLIDATGKFVGSDNKSANYHLEIGYDNLYNITSKKLTMTQTNLQFAGTLSAGHEFNYTYSDKNPMQLASVETKQYNVDGEIENVDEALAKNLHTQNYEFDDNGNMTSVSVASLKPETQEPETIEASEEKDVLKSFLWDEENRLLAVNNNGSVSCYFYDAAGERTVKLTSETEMVHVNGKKVGGNDAVTKFTAYVSPYFVVSNGGAYTKHIYAASQRIASKLGNEDGFGADPRRVEQAGGKKISDIQKDNIGARFSELGFTYTAPEKEKVEKDSTMDSEEPENLVFFYHPDHLGSTSYVTDADGNIAQHVEYIPYGEVFVEERNNSFSTNYLFNAKELDNETGLYYYGARYLDPTGAMWLSVDPLFEKYAGMSPYNYCMGNPVKMVDVDGLYSSEEEATGVFKSCYGIPYANIKCSDDGLWYIEQTDSKGKPTGYYLKGPNDFIMVYGSGSDRKKLDAWLNPIRASQKAAQRSAEKQAEAELLVTCVERQNALDYKWSNEGAFDYGVDVVGGIGTGYGNNAGDAAKFVNGAQIIGKAGSVVAGGKGAYDVVSTVTNTELTSKQKIMKSSTTIFGTIGGVVGGAMGAGLGGALGLETGPGCVATGVAGAIAGSVAGEKAGYGLGYFIGRGINYLINGD